MALNGADTSAKPIAGNWEGKGRYGSFRLRIERVGVQVKLYDPLRTRAIPERFWGDDARIKRRYIKCERKDLGGFQCEG